MKKSFFALASLMLVSINNNIQADHGGAVIGGLFGGLALGSVIGAAAASRPREVVVIEERQNNHDYSKLKNMERDLKNWQRDLEKYERELQKAERELEKRAERLTAREEKVDQLIERLEKK